MANKRLFEIGTSTQPADNDYRFALGKAGVPSINIDIDDFKVFVEDLLGYKYNAISLGQWNMTTTLFKTFAYTVPAGWAIKDFHVIVKNDTEADYYQINFDSGNGSGGNVKYVTATGFTVTVYDGGEFDNTDFDDANIERGHIIITLEKL